MVTGRREFAESRLPDSTFTQRLRSWMLPFVTLIVVLVVALGSVAAFSQPGQSTSSPANSTQVLRVGVYENSPKIFLDETGAPGGILGELLQQIADLQNWQLVPVVCQWSDCLDMLVTGQIDLMPDVAVSSERMDRFDFHDTPALMSWSQIYERPGGGLLSLLDLAGQRIAVLEASVQQEYLEQMVESFSLTVEWLQVDNLEIGFQAVQRGDADLVVANHFYGDAKAFEYGLSRTPILFQPVQLYYAVQSGQHAELLAVIDQYLRLWKSDGSSPYNAILSRWSLNHSESFVPTWLRLSVVLLLVALLFVTLFSVLLRIKVSQKTRHLAASEVRLNTILDSVEAFIYIKDYRLRYQYANRKVCELFGLPRDQIIGKTDEAFFDAKTCEHLRENDLRVIRQGERVADEETNISALDQKEHQFLSVKLPLRNPDGTIYALCGISTDITEHKQIRNQLHQLAFFDPLTGLPNRRLVLDRLDHAMASHARTGFEGALMLVDVDDFKTVNDTIGHNMGDLLLQRIARRIERGLLSTDTVGRLGADEFVLIVEDLAANADDALVRIRDMAEFLRKQLSQPFELNGGDYVCSVSIGVAMFSDTDSDPDALLKGADLALAAAKTAGRNQVRFFNPDMQTEVTRRTEIEKALRTAIDKGYLALHLQPQVDQNGIVNGMEALVRWTDPQLGQISPADFIPVAETSGLIVPMGQWIISQAADMLARWQHDPIMSELTLSINISPRQFHHPGFVEDIQLALNGAGINGNRLELEVTESLLIDDFEITAQRMQALRSSGIRFSLDDFGTGYASLGYLKRLPLSQLKIDQSFVRDLLIDQNDEAIVRTIIALGNSLDLRVIAEGVETQLQAERLMEMGCNHFQGYFYGRPEPESHWHKALGGPPVRLLTTQNA